MVYTTYEISVEICKRLRISLPSTIVDQVMVRCPSGTHQDANPSCSISLTKGVGHCFACGYSFTLRQLYYEQTGRGALRDMGIRKSDIQEETQHVEVDYSIVPDVSFEFNGQLVPAEKSRAGMSFMKSRGFTTQIVKSMGMKYCVKGVTKDTYDPTNKERWTWMTDRVLIPVYEQSKLICIEARDIRGEDHYRAEMAKQNIDADKHKYKKVLFPRGCTTSTLFQWEQLDTTSTLYAVEGLMDCASLRSCSEMKNSTAYFGMSINQRQLYLLDKFDEVVVIPDNDKAGLTTVKRLQKLAGSQLAKKMYILFPPKGAKDCNDILLGKCENAKSIEDAIRKQWLTKRVQLLNFNVDSYMIGD